PIAPNARLERAGAKTALVTTAGFEHLLHLRRQARAHLYRLCEPHPEPLVPLERCVGVRERIGPAGVLEELGLASLPELDAEAVAVCLLFSFRDPSHERAVAEEVRRRLPGAHVAASHEVAPEFREFERASTTAADAYLGPVVAGYARSLGRQCADGGRAEPPVMRSPGVVAEIAGGGSIAGVDPGGALRVGPRSAGADPGPACYGRGGREPTVTDANLLLGRLPERLAGGLELDRDAAERALGRLAPADVVDVVHSEMLRALRVVTVERGHDPRR